MPKRLKPIIYGQKPTITADKFNVGNVMKAITADLEAAGAKDPQGMVVKTSEAMKLVAQVTGKDAKKWKSPYVMAGVAGNDLVLVVRDSENSKAEEAVTMVANYAALKEKLAKQSGTVVNLDPTDKIINKASGIMGKKYDTEVTTEVNVDLNEKGDTAPIVILAHGADTQDSNGKVYAKEFADKTPAEIVKFLVKDKKLSTKYAGTLYLDGCFTAAGSTPQNFAKMVYDALVKAGYKYLKVKGNLGTAATTPEGREAVTDAQEEKAAKDELEKIQAALEPSRKKKAKANEDLATVNKIAQVLKTKWDEVWVKSYQTKDDVDGFFKDPAVQALIPKITTIQAKVADARKALEDEKTVLRGLKTKLKYKGAKQKVEDMETTYKYDIIDLVGTFGPEKVRSAPWYKKIFG
jgi:hypothetical protein